MFEESISANVKQPSNPDNERVGERRPYRLLSIQLGLPAHIDGARHRSLRAGPAMIAAQNRPRRDMYQFGVFPAAFLSNYLRAYRVGLIGSSVRLLAQVEAAQASRVDDYVGLDVVEYFSHLLLVANVHLRVPKGKYSMVRNRFRQLAMKSRAEYASKAEDYENRIIHFHLQFDYT
jgi:hypothetical protein